MMNCTAPAANGRPCVARDNGRCLWCNRSPLPPFESARCACGALLPGRDELAAVLDSAIDSLGEARPALERAVDSVELAGVLALVAFDVVRASALLHICAQCSNTRLRTETARILRRS
jgi:hypothetical protein